MDSDKEKPRAEEPYADPVVPRAIKCPHCGNIQPPTSSTCTACGREFDWEEAYQLYLSHMDEDAKVG